MNRETNSSQSTDNLRTAVDAPCASTETDGFFHTPSTIESESTYQRFPPQSAAGSVWEDALTRASTGLLHEWLDDDAANRHPRVGDFA